MESHQFSIQGFPHPQWLSSLWKCYWPYFSAVWSDSSRAATQLPHRACVGCWKRRTDSMEQIGNSFPSENQSHRRWRKSWLCSPFPQKWLLLHIPVLTSHSRLTTHDLPGVTDMKGAARLPRNREWLLCPTQTWATFGSGIQSSAGAYIPCNNSLFHSCPCKQIYSRGKKKGRNKRQILYLNCWSLVLLVLARNLSANFSKFLE